MKKQLTGEHFNGCSYWVRGEGEPILLLHGFAEDHSIWEHQTLLLSENFRVIVPDLPGSGTSPLPNEKLSIERLSDFVFEIMDAEGLSRALVFGHSMGGYIALAMSEAKPEKITGLGLIHSTAFADDELKKDNRRKSIRLIEHDGKAVFLKAMIPNLYSESSRNSIPNSIQNHLNLALDTNTESLINYYQAMIDRPDRCHILHQSQFPCLIVAGTEDNAVPVSQSLQMASMPACCDFHLLAETGHTSMIECPDTLNFILNKFCEYVYDLKNR
ncbi:MAG: alpha/beta hydrolase [Chitinophagaceae bacterium]|nr:alpha/beta hydrolase [Chitinophagaceae bacterium]